MRVGDGRTISFSVDFDGSRKTGELNRNNVRAVRIHTGPMRWFSAPSPPLLQGNSERVGAIAHPRLASRAELNRLGKRVLAAAAVPQDTGTVVVEFQGQYRPDITVGTFGESRTRRLVRCPGDVSIICTGVRCQSSLTCPLGPAFVGSDARSCWGRRMFVPSLDATIDMRSAHSRCI